MEKKFQSNSADEYPKKIFAHQLITTDDLEQFGKQLVVDLIAALNNQNGNTSKKWMKSNEVQRMLKISPGTLQTLKMSRVIPYTKIGGVHFYDHQDIQNILESGKINGSAKSSR